MMCALGWFSILAPDYAVPYSVHWVVLGLFFVACLAYRPLRQMTSPGMPSEVFWTIAGVRIALVVSVQLVSRVVAEGIAYSA